MYAIPSLYILSDHLFFECLMSVAPVTMADVINVKLSSKIPKTAEYTILLLQSNQLLKEGVWQTIYYNGING
jgi:hypothetical protein